MAYRFRLVPVVFAAPYRDVLFVAAPSDGACELDNKLLEMLLLSPRSRRPAERYSVCI